MVTIAFLHRSCCCCCLLIPLAKVLADAFGQGSGSHLCSMPLITQPAALRASYLRSGRMQLFNPFSIGVQALVSTISRENRGHPFWEGRGVSVAEMEAWLWQFLRLDKRNSPTTASSMVVGLWGLARRQCIRGISNSIILLPVQSRAARWRAGFAGISSSVPTSSCTLSICQFGTQSLFVKAVLSFFLETLSNRLTTATSTALLFSSCWILSCTPTA